jgi:hypothetical protein
VEADINLEASLQKSNPKLASTQSTQILCGRNQQKTKTIGCDGDRRVVGSTCHARSDDALREIPAGGQTS